MENSPIPPSNLRCQHRNGIWRCKYPIVNHPLETVFTDYGVREELAHYMIASANYVGTAI